MAKFWLLAGLRFCGAQLALYKNLLSIQKTNTTHVVIVLVAFGGDLIAWCREKRDARRRQHTRPTRAVLQLGTDFNATAYYEKK